MTRFQARQRDPFCWNRELLAYLSGLLDDLPGDLAAPRYLGGAEHAGRVTWLWLEEVSDDRGRAWPLAATLSPPSTWARSMAPIWQAVRSPTGPGSKPARSASGWSGRPSPRTWSRAAGPTRSSNRPSRRRLPSGCCA